MSEMSIVQSYLVAPVQSVTDVKLDEVHDIVHVWCRIQCHVDYGSGPLYNHKNVMVPIVICTRVVGIV